MHLYTIDTGFFKLDGGAMFGVVPKSIWKNLNPADENNMCNWAMRCLLVEDGNRLMLIDNGIGNKQSDKFFGYYYLNGQASLDQSLNNLGFSKEDITDVVLSHLHFDHCGGSVEWNDDKSAYRTAFKNAIYWSNEEHWKHALNSNPREKASFLKENILPIQESEQLKFVTSPNEVADFMSMRTVYGHTEAMMLPQINVKGQTVVFCADLIPSLGHLPVNYVMAYDIKPLESMRDRQSFLDEAVDNHYILFFEHDPSNECCTVKRNERGGFVVDKVFNLNEIF
ncbi:MAG: MBL fold metallo-hydrolase [Bacteroidia bacterium]|nr:MBL fold metallo-hydrolase [Bacteroidia bacterium]